MKIFVGARSSPLSQQQVWEVWREISGYCPVHFVPVWIRTQGDWDKHTPLWKTADDFFTREIDENLRDRTIRIAIHSAKDLPKQLAPDLSVVALTKGVVQHDSLIFSGLSLQDLPYAAKIGISSDRRRRVVSQIRSDLIPVDIRGTIHERLELIERGVVDALIMAEAACVRLHLAVPRIPLSHTTDPRQGRLAVVARSDDEEIRNFFSSIDAV